MVTEAAVRSSGTPTRRQTLLWLAGTACPAASGGAPLGAALAASWQQGAQAHLGLLTVRGGRLVPTAALPLPTRAHGLLVEPGGSMLAVARRPGDWLLRWHPRTGPSRMGWQEDDRRFNGHLARLLDGRILTTETDRETDQGWLGLRDPTTLAPLDAWPTHGRDPHQVLVLPQAVGRWPAGTLLVANGGVAARAETGRSRVAGAPLDASLVALDPRDGRLLGVWRLPDALLSIRHLAWSPDARRVGVALQAEHPAPADREAAPVLAVWDGAELRPASGQPALGGYGGDILALPAGPVGGFAVGCTHAGTLAFFSAQGRFAGAVAQPASCALAGDATGWWNAGRDGALVAAPPADSTGAGVAPLLPVAPDLHIDNHWQRWP